MSDVTEMLKEWRANKQLVDELEFERGYNPHMRTFTVAVTFPWCGNVHQLTFLREDVLPILKRRQKELRERLKAKRDDLLKVAQELSALDE